ncbi:MAG: hypothetical protein R3E66_07650 [bacterium]
MQRLWISLVFILSLLAADSAFAEGWKGGMTIRSAGNVGVGLGAGTLASGLSLKYFADSNFAIQGNVGWWRSRWWGCDNRRCYGGGDALAVSADAIFEQPVFAGNGSVDLAWNFGLGGGLGLSDYNNNIGAAAAGILGLEVLINVIPIDIVLEFRPNILVVPDVAFDLVDFTGHIRFYF